MYQYTVLFDARSTSSKSFKKTESLQTRRTPCWLGIRHPQHNMTWKNRSLVMMILNVSGMFEALTREAWLKSFRKNLKRRAHLNDMENIYPFVFLSLLAVLQNLGARPTFSKNPLLDRLSKDWGFPYLKWPLCSKCIQYTIVVIHFGLVSENLKLHFYIFTLARLAHTIVYVCGVRQPARALCFTLGTVR